MTKRKCMSTTSVGSSAGTAIVDGSTVPVPEKKKLSRHMYTNEQHRFVWFHREVLKFSAIKTHSIFHSYFKPDVAISVDGLNQLFGRLRRTQPKEVLSTANHEPWAVLIPPAEKLEIKAELKHTDYVTNGSHLHLGPRKHEREDSAYGCEGPSSSSPDPVYTPVTKRARHMYTNEQHRFVWFYRNDLQKDPLQTSKAFQDYFNLPLIERSTLNQLYGRLKSQMSPEVVKARHTEPWAVGRPNATIREGSGGDLADDQKVESCRTTKY